MTGHVDLRQANEGYAGHLYVRKRKPGSKEWIGVYLPITDKQRELLGEMGIEEYC